MKGTKSKFEGNNSHFQDFYNIKELRDNTYYSSTHFPLNNALALWVEWSPMAQETRVQF